MKQYIKLLIISFTLMSCSSAKEPAPEKKETAKDQVTLTAEQMQHAGVQLDTVRRQAINGTVEVNGQIDVPPQNIVSVSFPYNSYLKNTRLIPGMKVHKGDALATMEDPAIIQLQQDYLIAKAKLAYLELDHQRQKTLQENNANSEKVYQQVASELKTQQILVKAYDEKLRLIGINPAGLNENNISRSVVLRAPISGFVSKVNVNTGKYVTASDILFELIDPGDIHATLNVYEKDLLFINQGQAVEITAVNDPKQSYKASVHLINKNISDSRNAEVHCHFSGTPPRLLPGMFIQGRIHIVNKEAIAVPEQSVVRHGSEQLVLLYRGNNTFKLVPVETGINNNGMVEIKGDNLPQGSVIATQNAYSILAQLKNTAEE